MLCRVKSWLSRRLVSLPFSDHCEPLVDRPDDLSAMLGFLADELGEGRWRSFELRPRAALAPSRPCERAPSYCLHTLDLARPAEQIFDGFHHSSTQRAIRRAEREGLATRPGTPNGCSRVSTACCG